MEGTYLVETMILDSNYKQLDSGLIVPDDFKSYPTAFDFFAGLGGFSLGFIQAGYEVIGMLEIDPAATHTYMVNLCSYPVNIHYTSDKYQEILEKYFEKVLKKQMKRKNSISVVDGLTESEIVDLLDGTAGSGWIRSQNLQSDKYYPPVKNIFFGDITEVNGDWISEKLGIDIGEIDLVAAGPPCQGFSKANKNRSPNDPRNELVFEYARMIAEMQPKTFILENVPDIVDFVTPEGIPVLDGFAMILEDGGYGKLESIRNSLLVSSGVGFTKKGTGFRMKSKNELKSKKDNFSKSRKKKIKEAIYPIKNKESQISIFKE